MCWIKNKVIKHTDSYFCSTCVIDIDTYPTPKWSSPAHVMQPSLPSSCARRVQTSCFDVRTCCKASFRFQKRRDKIKTKKEREIKGWQCVTQCFSWMRVIGVVFEWLKSSCLLVRCLVNYNKWAFPMAKLSNYVTCCNVSPQPLQPHEPSPEDEQCGMSVSLIEALWEWSFCLFFLFLAVLIWDKEATFSVTPFLFSHDGSYLNQNRSKQILCRMLVMLRHWVIEPV